MKTRGTNPNIPQAGDYSARGITVCGRWLGSFKAFYSDMGPCPSPRHTIERVENHKGYSPDNCRWATYKEQSLNKRNNRLVTLNGVTKHVREWCVEANIALGTFYYRKKKGMTDEEALAPRSQRKEVP
jgi:hypothetical protein